MHTLLCAYFIVCSFYTSLCTLLHWCVISSCYCCCWNKFNSIQFNVGKWQPIAIPDHCVRQEPIGSTCAHISCWLLNVASQINLEYICYNINAFFIVVFTLIYTLHNLWYLTSCIRSLRRNLQSFTYFNVVSDRHVPCENGQYISADHKCDGWVDCVDSQTDELNCKSLTAITG